ncbi:MAG: LamG-like jellyroll fold domain-containing protein [Minisyncoccia bacterium]
MSYKLEVLKDNPIGFWPLDEIYSSYENVSSYNDSTNSYNADVFYNSGISYSATPQDISGCGNDGGYIGDFPLNNNILPLVLGGVYGTNITNNGHISLPATKNYYGNIVSGGNFANSKSSDNDFSLEIWFKPSIITTNRTTIFADDINNIGIFYENSNILFKLNSEELYYNLNSQNKVFHIVAVYSVSSMIIYIDGQIAARKSIDSFKFSNSNTENFKIGPTANAQDSFVVDAPAIYRYSLSRKQVYSHYQYGIYHINAFQIVTKDNGFFFPCHEENLKPSYVYEYGPSKMSSLVAFDSYYNKNNNYISFYKSTGEKSLVLFDTIILPSTLSIVSSKAEWKSDKNILVEMGTDGTTYPYTLINGSYLPFYNKEDTLGNRVIYLKITFSTSDASKYFPKFTHLRIKFYSSKDLYSENSKYYITSDKEYDIASFNYPPLLRMQNDGIQTSATGGFKINADESINTVEFFYTPSALTASTLINNASANFSWNGSGVISKTNINSIYVNGEDRSAATTASSIFTENQPHHVVIKFTSGITGDIKFNYNVAGGPSNKFNNIALYTKALTSAEILRHYSEYISRPTLTSADSTMTVTEDGINYANNEWVVISTI